MSAAKRHPPDFILHDPPPPPMSPISPSTYQQTPSLRNARAIVLDLGSSALRAGFSTSPHPPLQLPPMVARMRDPDTGLRTFLIGNDALVSSARSTARPAYESGIPNNPALMERLLDGTLANLGLAEQDVVSHRCVLTESPCQPNSARALIMEILFEAYLVPGLTFGIDALFSYLYNAQKYRSQLLSNNNPGHNALVVSCGYNSTHVLPLIGGKLHPTSVKRINVGGMHMTDQLSRRLRLLHTDHAPVLTEPRVELLKEKICYVSSAYDLELNRLKTDVDFYNSVTKYVRVPTAEGTDKPALSPEEQQRLHQARVENGRRLSEIMREKRRVRKEKDSPAADDTEDASFTQEEVAAFYAASQRWYDLNRIYEISDVDEDKFYVALAVHKFETKDALMAAIASREQERSEERDKLSKAKAEAAEAAFWKRVKEDELLSMSDTDLNASDLKRKRHVRALRGAAEARGRARRAKEAEKAEEERKAKELRKMREERPKEYVKMLKDEREVLAGRIKKRSAAREAGSDRRSQAARERMRLLAQHAGNKASVEEPGKGRGRGRLRAAGRGKAKAGRGKARGKGSRGGGKKAKGEEEEDDNFGWNDSDWDVYRAMKVGGESDSEDNSGEERERLEKVRAEIRTMLPQEVDPTVSHPEGVALLYEENRHADEMPVTVDRIRTGEMLFQPTLAGVEQCGLAEAIALSVGDRSEIVKEVFVTGGVARMKGLAGRLGAELRQRFATELGDGIEGGLQVARDPVLDGWRGAALFAEEGGEMFEKGCVTKGEWEEMGPGYLKEHAMGNAFFKTPVLSAADLERKKKMQKQASKRGRPRGLLLS